MKIQEIKPAGRRLIGNFHVRRVDIVDVQQVYWRELCTYKETDICRSS